MPESESGIASESGCAVGAGFLVAVGQDFSRARIGVRRLLDAPVHDERVVGELTLGPQMFLARRFALRVVVDDFPRDFPVAVVAVRHFPAGEIQPGEERDEAIRRLRDFLRFRIRRRQLAEADVAELTLRAFAFEHEVAFARRRAGGDR